MQVAEQGPPGAMRLESHATRRILPDATEKLLKAGPPGHTTQKLARRARRLPKVYAIPNHSTCQSRKDPEKGKDRNPRFRRRGNGAETGHRGSRAQQRWPRGLDSGP